MGDDSMFISYITLIPLIALIVGIILISAKKAETTGKTLFTIGYIFIAVVSTFIGIITLSFSNANASFYNTVLVIIAVLLSVLILGFIWRFGRRKKIYIPLVSAIVFCLLLSAGFNVYQGYIDSIPTLRDNHNLLTQYRPYYEETKVAELSEESSLKINENIPKMDGATALYPMYSAFAKAVYPKEMLEDVSKGNEILKCSTTTNAYYNIVTGDADIIFVGGPSKEQEEFAKENGVELVYTPIGREAFVFFVNSKNPLENITIKQIQDIYSGNITKWDELNVSGFGEIRAFQRDEGSGSQTALVKLMGDKELINPIEENVIGGMGGIISKTADYKNYKNAIGYSFRYYSQEMVNNNQIKLLNIEGIEPNLKNIENGTYPIASEFFAVTRTDADENTKKLLDWVLSNQGQELVKRTGYTPVR